jgi:hypothetical protein
VSVGLAAKHGETADSVVSRAGQEPARAWMDLQAEREGALRLRARTTASLAHQACLLIGLIFVGLGLSNGLGLLSSGPLAACAYLSSGLALLRWVAGGKGSPVRDLS